MAEILEKAVQWLKQGQRVAVATVIKTWGSSPRAVGSELVVNDTSEFFGSVSGGCIEGAVITEALEVMEDGAPRILNFTVDNERAWEVGLTCGGDISILIVRATNTDILESVLKSEQNRQPDILITDVNSGEQFTTTEETFASYSELRKKAEARLKTGQSELIQLDEGKFFLNVKMPTIRVLIFGAVHITQALAPMAQLAGMDVRIIDPREAFATPARFPDLKLYAEWPDEFLEHTQLDSMTAVVTLTHDPKIDDIALKSALQNDVLYIGSLGSKKTHQKRVDRFLEYGFSEEQITKVHAPVGLDLGGRQPNEIAVAILAEILQVRYK